MKPKYVVNVQHEWNDLICLKIRGVFLNKEVKIWVLELCENQFTIIELQITLLLKVDIIIKKYISKPFKEDQSIAESI